MIEIQIDTQAIAEQFYMDQSQINDLMDYTVKEITARFAAEWENEANRTLKTSRQEYIANLNVIDEGFAKGAVLLTGWLPNAVEQGMDGFSMIEGFLNGPNAKTSKSGAKYNTIPFSFGAPGSLPENFTGGILPTEVHEILKERNAGEQLTSFDLKNLPQEYKQPQVKQVIKPVSKTFEEYQHKSSIYEGVSKRTDLKTGQNSYGSFRRVSDSSDSNSWIHPGLEAQQLADKVLQSFNIPQEVGKILDTYFS